MEEIAIVRRLLNHRGVEGVPVRPPLLVGVVAIYETGEEGLVGGGGEERVRVFVECEGEGDGGEDDVEFCLRVVVSLGGFVRGVRLREWKG